MPEIDDKIILKSVAYGRLCLNPNAHIWMLDSPELQKVSILIAEYYMFHI